MKEQKKTIIKNCPKHGLTEFVECGSGKYKRFKCKKCIVDAVIKKRHKNKQELVEYKGGKCEICGYDKCIDALEFHHLDPKEKEFGISNGNIKSLEKLKKEADKCILLCSNCHRELHAKLREKDQNYDNQINNSSDQDKINKVRNKVNKIDTLDINKISNDINDGMKQADIAKKYQVSISTLKRFIKKYRNNI